jgi:hypothetical protein
MTDLDRRQFLKGLLGVAAVAAVAAPELAKAVPPRQHIGIDHAHGPDKAAWATAKVDFNGVIYIDGIHVVPGDTILIQYQYNSENNGIYEVTAVAKDGSGQVVLAHVHEDREIEMHRDDLEGHINREIRRKQDFGNFHTGHYPVELPKGVRKPSRKTWPNPRGRRGFRY